MVQIRLMSQVIHGTTFSIGRCNVQIGNSSIGGIAVACGTERRILDDDGARDWLVRHGLTTLEATEFMQSGLTAWDEMNTTLKAN